MSNVIEFTIRGVDKASTAFKSFSQNAVAATKKVAVSAARMGKRFAVAFVAAAGAAFLLMKSVAGAQDRVAKISLRLGIAVDKLSEFHHAAELGGLSTEQFDMGLQRMTRRVAEAAEGIGEARGALIELGIDAKAMAKLPLDEQMNQVADALHGVENQSEKVRLAFKLFDSEGVGILQTMEKGSQSFRDAAADLEYLGGVMSAQGTANSTAFMDAWTRMKTAISGVSMALGETFIPIFTGIMTMFTDFIAQNRGRFVAFLNGLVVGFLQFGYIVGQVASTIGETYSNLFDVDTFATTLGNILGGIRDMLVGMVDMFKVVGPRLAMLLVVPFKAAWGAFKELATGALDHVFDLLTGNDIARPFGEIVSDAVRAAATEMDVLPSLMANVGEIIIETAESTGAALKDIYGINTELAKAQAEDLLAGMMEFGEVVEQTQADTHERTMGYLDLLREEMNLFLSEQKDFTTEFAGRMFKTMMDATKAVGQGFAEMIVDGKKGSEVFKQIAKDIAKQIIATYIALKLQRIIAARLTPGEAGANMMATMSAAPWPLNMTAPAFAASHAAQAAAYASGVAHGGADFIPQEATYLLNKGERVLSPKQNTDLTGFLQNDREGGGTGGGNNIEVNIYTTANNFDDIDEAELEDFVAGPLLRTLDKLDDRGVRQKAIERKYS